MVNTMIPMPIRNAAGVNGKMKGGHIGLRTIDLEATIKWYVDMLGFRLLKKWTVGELKMAFLAPANDDDFWLEVLNGPETNAHQDPSLPIISGFQHFCLDVESVDETLTALGKKDIKVLYGPFDVPAIGKRCGFITDLYGNVIEFAENI